MSTSHLKIPQKEIEMTGIKGLVGKKMSKTVKFIGEDIKISKLSVGQVSDIQEKAKALNDAKAEDEKSGLELLKTVIRSSVEGAEELTDEDFLTFPMEELTKLSNEIMKFSGIDGEKGK